jgi:hypothetical protein
MSLRKELGTLPVGGVVGGVIGNRLGALTGSNLWENIDTGIGIFGGVALTLVIGLWIDYANQRYYNETEEIRYGNFLVVDKVRDGTRCGA